MPVQHNVVGEWRQEERGIVVPLDVPRLHVIGQQVSADGAWR